MQKVIYTNQIQEYTDKINQTVIDYLNTDQIELVESFPNYNIIAFQIYDIENIFKHPEKIMIYIDKEDLFYLCNTIESYNIIGKYYQESETNEHALYLFFENLLKGNNKHLEIIEDRISKVDTNIINEIQKNARSKIMGLQYEILRLKKYYEQFDFILKNYVSMIMNF